MNDVNRNGAKTPRPPTVTGFLALSGATYSVGADIAFEDTQITSGEIFLYDQDGLVRSKPFAVKEDEKEIREAFSDVRYPAGGGTYKLKIVLQKRKGARAPLDEASTFSSVYPFALDDLDGLRSGLSFRIVSGEEPVASLDSDRYALTPDEPTSLAYSFSTTNGFLRIDDMQFTFAASVTYTGTEAGKSGTFPYTWKAKAPHA